MSDIPLDHPAAVAFFIVAAVGSALTVAYVLVDIFTSHLPTGHPGVRNAKRTLLGLIITVVVLGAAGIMVTGLVDIFLSNLT